MASETKNSLLEMDEFYRDIGRKIATKRRALNKTQEQLAEAVDLSRTSVVNIEKGAQRILAHKVYEIAHELDMTLSELLPSSPLTRPLERMEASQRDLLLRVVPTLGTVPSK